MVELVSIDDAKVMLRIDGSDHDAMIGFAIEAASGAVINYLKSAARSFVGANGEVYGIVPPEVRMATVFLAGVMMRNPDNTVEGDFDQGFLPKPVTALLYPLRDPACA